MDSFKGSRRFGLIGVFVVAAICVVIALTLGSGSANPKGALILIFGVIAAFFVLLFLLQFRDLGRAESADVRGTSGGPSDVTDPTKVDEPALWAAMAIGPIDEDAIRARAEMWETGRTSMKTGVVVTALILVAVPLFYLTGSFIPLAIGGGLAVLIALYRSMRIMAAGGDVDQAYQRSDRAMAPLGLHIVEHPKVVIETKGIEPYRQGPGMRGQLLMQGERHGRQVTVAQPTTGTGASPSEVTLAGQAPQFELKARDGRLRAAGAPAQVAAVLDALPASNLWNGVSGTGGPGGIVIRRKSGAGQGWLRDLWLAERLADSLAG